MVEEKRRFSRITGESSVSLFVKDKKSGEVVAGPVSGILRNISSFGAGVSVVRIQADNTHFFYATTENPELELFIEVQVPGSDDLKLNTQARPVWFDRVLSDSKTPFHLGLEFINKLNKEQLKQLKSIVVEIPLDKPNTWDVFIQKLNSFFEKLKNSV